MNNHNKSAADVRAEIRTRAFAGVTAGLAPGSTQANLAILPKEYAFDFLLFCQRNRKPCPLIEVLDPGQPEPLASAPGSDIRTDLPAYRIYRDGVLEAEVPEINEYWRDDLVSFLMGCSFTFEEALIRAQIPMRHIEEGTNVSMYVTNMETRSAGVFSGPMVVSMRPIPHSQVVKAVQVTSRYPDVHGAPVHIGNPKAIGIRDISKPDYGDPVEIREDETPVFWACGVTPQAVAEKSRPSLMITHAPGYMFVTDIPNETTAAL
jgi:uncharacterized protein YcsI (UPF0317 family)